MRTRSDARLADRGPLIAAFRWVGGHVRGFYAAVGVFLLIGLFVVLGAAGLFALLAWRVRAGDTQSFDEAVLLWMNSHATPWLDVAALEVTTLGAGVVLWMLVAVASAFLWVNRHHYSVFLLWIAVLGGGLLNSTLKSLFERPRPELFPWRTPHVGQSSFPSGHSMGAMAAYATLAYLIARLEPTPILRHLTFAVAAVVVLLIGMSRMYLGVHYPSDVIGGFIIGLAWAALCALTIEAIQYFRGRKPGIEKIEKAPEPQSAQER